MSKNTGGPAFPSGNEVRYGPGDLYQTNGHAGITLRDYFAAKAMQALVGATQSMTHITVEMVACESYVYADAMLAEREKE